VQDLEPLGSLSRLKYLSLVDNPVTKQPGYRLFVINRCPKLKMLDFRKVKQQEREEAGRVFGGQAAPAAATFEPEEELAAVGAAPVAEPSIRKGPTPEQLTAIKTAIAAASTLEEVRRLEEALQTGSMPSELAGYGAAAMEQG
jgi:U2 small nuclear ribonucleoprotein A'